MQTHVESVNCGNCGAPLRIPETAQFVTCNHCKSSLAVKRMDSITLTERMEQTHERLEETERKLAELVYKNEISEENRRWEREERELMVTDKQGNKHKPSMAGGIMAMVVTLFIGLIAAGGLGPIALLFPLVGFFGLMMTMHKVKEYDAAYRKHRQRLRGISERYYQSRDGGTHSEYLKQLESAPTPEDYLRELSRT
jgi:DNA-directed RNA polymerase subunit RPC12/RpoP